MFIFQIEVSVHTDQLSNSLIIKIVEHVQNGLRVGALENLTLDETTIFWNFHLVHFAILLLAGIPS